MIKIIQVRALDTYQLECTFENGEKVLYDMGYVLKEKAPMIDPLKDPSVFKKVFLESGSPAWENGYDLCPDAIWQETHFSTSR